MLNLHSETVSRIDPRKRAVLRTQGIGNAPGNLAASAQEVWIAAGCTLGGSPGELQRLYTATEGGVDTFGDDDLSLAGVVRGGRSNDGAQRARAAVSSPAAKPCGPLRTCRPASCASTTTR